MAPHQRIDGRSASLGTSGYIRAGRACRVGGFELVCEGVTDGVEPLAASSVVYPPFGEIAPGVVAVEQEFGPFGVRERIRVFRVGDVGFTPVTKFGFISWPAVRAINKHHGNCLS